MTAPATPHCHDDAHFAQALAGDLADADFDQLIAHFDHCPACRARYDTMLQDSMLSFKRPSPPAAEIDTALAELLDRTKAANDWTTQQHAGDGRFQIIRKIGQGGMGEIYECFDQKLNRLVALKKLRTDRLTPSLLARLKKEASMQAALRSPHIVQIYDVGTLNGIPFLALEFISGGSLRDRLQEKPIEPTAAARLVSKIAAAMHLAHQDGVLHRDLKPANILLNNLPGDIRAGFELEPKIADFGLAKLMGESSDLSESAVIVGTPAYLSPEQAAHRTGEIGPRSDIYSIGVILYECLTGHPPFNADNSGLLVEMIKSLEPVSPRKLVPGISRDLETICLKCLAKEPARRYADAQALADDLQRFLEGRPIVARPAGPLETAWRWSLRNRRLAVSLATIFVLVSWFSLYAFWSANRQNRLRLLAEAQTARANQSEAKAIDQRDRAFTFYLKELRKSNLILEMLDQVKAKLGDQAGVQRVQAFINSSSQEDMRQFLQDSQLISDRPDIAVEMLYQKALLSQISLNPEESKASLRLLMAYWDQVPNPAPATVVHWMHAVYLLSNDSIGRNRRDEACVDLHKIWAWYKAGHQHLVQENANVLEQFRFAMQVYQAILLKENRPAEAAEVAQGLALIKPGGHD